MSQSALSVRFEYKNTIRGVKLFPGIQVNELQDILKSIFGLSSNIIGFSGKDNVIIPLSLACRSPQLLINQLFTLVVSGEDSINNSLNNSLNIEDLSKENDDIEVATAEIYRFITGLKSKNIINEQKAKLIEGSLNDSNLLFAAYSVAVSANDARYFANICKDISQSLETEAGQLVCEAQDEVLQICDELYLNKRITENQLLYLRHLVLIREGAVADIYDDFQDQKIDTSEMAKLLYELANVHPKDNTFNLSTASATHHRKVGDDQEEEDEYEAEKNKNIMTQSPNNNNTKVITPAVSSATTRSRQPPSLPQYQQEQRTDAERASDANNHLCSVIVSMIDSKLLSITDAALLMEMLEEENEFIMSAFELFLSDGDEKGLSHTLLRCLRLEVKKRGFMKKMEQLSSEQQQQLQQHLLQPYNDVSTADDVQEEEGEEDEDFDDLDDLMLKQGYDYSQNVDDDDDEDDEHDNAEEEEEEDDEAAKVNTDSIMSALNIDNVWSHSAPAIFISTLFKAAYRKQISIHQAKKACDMYKQGDDYIRAVWDVYTLQKDEIDFIDSVGRITRPFEKEEANRGGAPEKQNQLREQQSQLQAQLALNEQEKSRVLHSTEEAMSAIKEAKKELLKHSLDMMMTSNVITQLEADKVYQLVKRDSHSIVDHVIDSYASDRDVSEFMKSLKMLATFVSEEADDITTADNGSAGDEIELAELRQTVAKTVSGTSGRSGSASAVLPPPLSANDNHTSNSTSIASSLIFATKTQKTKTQPSHVAKHNKTVLGEVLHEGDDDDDDLVKPEQIELSQIILELNKAKVVNDKDASYLLQLVKRKDEAIMKSYETLLKERNFDGFIDMLLARTSAMAGGSGTSVSGSSIRGSSSSSVTNGKNSSSSSSSSDTPIPD